MDVREPEESMTRQRMLAFGLCVGLVGGCWAAAQNPPAAATQPPVGSSGSPAAKIGLFVYPQKEQTSEQQAQDERGCYASAQQQTGIDPTAAPQAPPDAEKKKGGAVKGAAGGAAGGAAIGAIAGDAGTGSAVGATAGADDTVSTLLVFADTLRRGWGFAFPAAFPFGDFGVCGDGAVIPGVAGCGVGVETVGSGGGVGVDNAAPGGCV